MPSIITTESETTMNPWTLQDWKKHLPSSRHRRFGLRLRFDKGVSQEVKTACIRFATWLRSQYTFPLRVPVYIKKQDRIKAKDGDLVVGTFFEPLQHTIEPYIRIATGDYEELKEEIGRDQALASILTVIAHELTHYFQWISGIQKTERDSECQAHRCAKKLLKKYAETREHP